MMTAEVIGAWWCSWSSKPVRGREGPGWVRFPFASAIFVTYCEKLGNKERQTGVCISSRVEQAPGD